MRVDVDIEISVFSVIATEQSHRTWRDVAIRENRESGEQFFIYHRGVEGADNPAPSEQEVKFVYIDSAKTVFLPENNYVAGKDLQYFDLHNIEIDENEQIVTTKPIHGMVAIIAVKKGVLKRLGKLYGEFNIASALQYNLMCARVDRERMKEWNIDRHFCRDYQRLFKRYKHKYISMYTTEFNTYITLFDRIEGDFSAQRLLYKAILPMNRNINFGLFMEPINSMFNISRIPIYVRGINAQHIIGHISQQYKKVIKE